MSLGSARDKKAAWGAVGSLARGSLQKAFFFSLGSKGQDPAEPRLQLFPQQASWEWRALNSRH